MSLEDKVRENRLRRMADRRGLRLEKSRRRDPNALVYGTYQLVDIRMNAVVAQDFTLGQGYGLDLDAIEAWLMRGDSGRNPVMGQLAANEDLVQNVAAEQMEKGLP